MYSLLFRNRSFLGRLMQLQLKFIILISYWRHCATSPLTSSAVNNDRRANALMYAVLLLLLGGCWYMSLGLLVCLPVCPSPLHPRLLEAGAVIGFGLGWDGDMLHVVVVDVVVVIVCRIVKKMHVACLAYSAGLGSRPLSSRCSPAPPPRWPCHDPKPPSSSRGAALNQQLKQHHSWHVLAGQRRDWGWRPFCVLVVLNLRPIHTHSHTHRTTLRVAP